MNDHWKHEHTLTKYLKYGSAKLSWIGLNVHKCPENSYIVMLSWGEDEKSCITSGTEILEHKYTIYRIYRK